MVVINELEYNYIVLVHSPDWDVNEWLQISNRLIQTE